MNHLQKIFGKKELLTIAGRNGSNVLWLGVISLLALLVLGFAESIEHFLEEKMDNPHVKLVEVNWPSECARKGLGVTQFRALSMMRYGTAIRNVQGVVKENDYFLDRDGTLKFGRIGFVTRHSDILYQLAMSDPSEFISPMDSSTLMQDTSAIGLASFTAKEGVIVSRSFLRRLGLAENAKSIDLQMSCDRIPLTLPVSAVLKNLPSEVDVIMHEHLWTGILGSRGSFMTDSIWNGFVAQSKSTYFLVPDVVWETSSAKTKKSFKSQRRAPAYSSGVIRKKKRRAKIPEGWEEYGWVNPSFILGMEASKVQGDSIEWSPSGIGVMFESIDSVRVFADWIQNDSEFVNAVCPDEATEDQADCAIQNQVALKVDLSKIKSKEFLSLFNRIAELLRYFLMASASLLLMMRCNALFQLHIEKNRASLGTLKAFGLSNEKIIGLYASIAVLMLLTAFIVSIVALAALGPFTVELAKSILNIRPEDAVDLTYRNMDLMQGFVAFVLLPIVYVSNRIRKLLRLSPGALVFGRKTTST